MERKIWVTKIHLHQTKGKIVLPHAVLEHLNVTFGDYLAIHVQDDGTVQIREATIPEVQTYHGTSSGRLPPLVVTIKVPSRRREVLMNALEGPYYAELDEETNLYCVFHCDTGKAHATCSTMQQAEDRAKELNDAHIAREDR